MGTSGEKQKRELFDFQIIPSFCGTQSRDRTGMEVNPLVFETSASTNSAIWADLRCKDMDFFCFCQIILQKNCLIFDFLLIS